MFRKNLMSVKQEKKDRIRWRSHEVTRIEAFSDAVIAFSVTLLIVSLEVPESFDQLMRNMVGFLPFGVCFLLLFYIWKVQHLFFRRYNLHDTLTYNLNGALLFVLLFFVYPLKYLSLYMMHSLTGEAQHLSDLQLVKIMCIYSGGYTAIFLLLALMYRNALSKRTALELTEGEVFETKTNIYEKLIMASFGAASMLLAICSPTLLGFSGIIYAFVGIPISLLHTKRNRRYKQRFEHLSPLPVAHPAAHPTAS